MFEALKSRSLKKVKQAIKEDPNSIHEDVEGKYPVEHAVAFKSPQILKLLIEKGADIKDIFCNRNLYHYCCLNNLYELAVVVLTTYNGIEDLIFNFKPEQQMKHLKFLVSTKYFRLSRDNQYMILYKAIMFNLKLPEMKFLIKKCDKIQSRYNMYNPLTLSISKEQSQIPSLLVRKGASPNSTDEQGLSAMVHALRTHRKYAFIKFLFRKGYNVGSEYKGQKFLKKKVTNGNSKYVQDINTKSTHLTALHFAICFESDIRIVELIIKKAGNINKESNNGYNALHFACLHHNRHKYVELLIKNYVKVKPYKNGKSLLLKAIFSNFPVETIKLLIMKGSKFTKNDSIDSILSLSFKWDIDLAILNYLAKYEQESIPFYKQADLHTLIKNGRGDIIESVLRAGADPNEIHEGETPLYLACMKNNKHAIKTLLQYGADIELQNPKTGEKPLSVLKDQKLIKLAKIYLNFIQDFKQLYKKKILTDSKIITNDSKECKFHKIIFQCRIGKYIDISQFIKICQNYTFNQVDIFMKWLYTGFNKKYNLEIIEFFFSSFGISLDLLKEKSGKTAFVNDITQLYHDEDSKDFSILIPIINKENETVDIPIKVHKAVLIARSELYREMFSTIEPDSTSVHDYTDNKVEVLQHFIHYLYTDKIDSTISDDILFELSLAEDYYMLSQYSSLFPRISQITQERKKN
ncbi:cyclin-dependent kinase inhibitor 2c [Anaeramoeba flamelloides]|uniref:Cyclin-dependent kinase inhibitor 2c n=1 Tax=Anaeramoeba flamelloides TaxID=1746091 RepID=A0AAV7YLY8_9EUKA|nr:cyclin-dependent kinase inhibitor 2c [Anaeramoeba flamelloides]